MTHRGSTVIQRLLPAAGVAVLALTATPWIGKSIRTEGGTVDRTFSFWGLFESVRQNLVAGLGLGAAVLVAFILVSVLVDHARPAAGTVLSWLAALTTLIVLLNVDSGYSAGPGLWLTLVVTSFAAIAGTIDWTFSANGARRRSGPEQG